MISTSFALFVNHLLAKEPWARERLQKHANKLVCIDLDLIQLRVRIAADGLLQAADTQTDASNVRLRIQPADLPLIAQDPKKAVSYVKIEGDADLANVISGLSQDLRWEIEEDLAQMFGDITATRMVAGGQAMLSHFQRTQQSFKENFAEYFLEENPMLVRPQALQAFASQVVKTRDDVERMMKRIERLEKMKVQK